MTDGFSLNPDGTITFEFSGVTRVLRRPTLKQYRASLETLSALRDEAAGDAEEGDVSSGTIKMQLDKIVEWLDQTIKSLSGEGLPRASDGEIDEDLLPAWLLSGEVIRDVITHWQTVPSRHGGR